MSNYLDYILRFSEGGVGNTLDNVTKKLGTLDKATYKLGALFDISLFKLNQFASATDNVNQGLQALAAPGAAFDQNMKELSAITGIAGKELDNLSLASREMGVSSGLGATQAAEAFKLLASNIDVSTIGIDGLKKLQSATITLSQAAGVDLPTAANTMAASINQFGLSANDAGRVIDVLAAGAKYGAAEVPDLSESLKVAGVTAAAAKISLESTVGALEILSQNAVKGSEAGTGLRNVMLKLQTSEFLPPGVNLKTDGLAKSLQKLQPYLNDTAGLAKIFGAENINAAQILIKNAGAVDEMTGKVSESGIALQQADINNSSFNHGLAVLKAGFDDFKITIFETTKGLLPYVQLMSEGAIIAANLGPLLNVFGSAGSALKTAFIWVKDGGILTSLKSMYTGLMGVLPGLWANITAAWAWTAALLANPITWIVVGIVALGAAIWATIKYWDDIKQAVTGFVQHAVQYIGQFVDWIGGVLGKMGAVIWKYHPLRWLINGVDALIPGFKAKLAKVWDTIAGFFGGMMQKLAQIPGVKQILGLFGGGAAAKLNVSGTMASVQKPAKDLGGLFDKDTDNGGFAASGPQGSAVEQSLKNYEGPDKKLDIKKKKSKGLGEDGIGSVSGGGKEVKNITITIQKMVENVNLSTINMQQGAAELKQIIEETLLRAIQGADLAAGQ